MTDDDDDDSYSDDEVPPTKQVMAEYVSQFLLSNLSFIASFRNLHKADLSERILTTELWMLEQYQNILMGIIEDSVGADEDDNTNNNHTIH